jgi:hypothetical protein
MHWIKCIVPLLLLQLAYAFIHVRPRFISSPSSRCAVKTIQEHEKVELNRVKDAILRTAIATLALPVFKAYAAQGSIKPPSQAETVNAVNAFQEAFNLMAKAETYAKSKEWQKIGDILSTPPFLNLESNANIIVRSEGLSAEDKKTLGTIKRYGTVADAIIMVGGLSGELKAGGVKMKEGGKLQEGIEDDGAEEEDEEKTINEQEVDKYIKLAKGSLNDVLSIAKKLL